MMFTIGALSPMFPAGGLAITMWTGSTISVPGAMPKLHMVVAPAQT
jgi:hypothetical protein